MRTLESMSKDERSLLLYFESRAVDNGGKIDAFHMNREDFIIAERWNEEDFVGFGRICMNDILSQKGTHWCHLSDKAFALAHEERKARAYRVWQKKNFTTTAELREVK